MKILWVKPILPYPPSQGTRRVTLGVLQHLAPHHTIRLFTRLLTRDEAPQVRALERAVPGLTVRAVLAPNRRSAFHRAWYRWRLRTGSPAIPPVEAYVALPELLRRFDEDVREFDPDLVVCEYWMTRAYLDRVGDRPAVLFAHDIEFQARQRAARFAQESGRGGRWSALEAARERDALIAAPASWYLTEADRETAIGLGVSPATTGILRHGLDLSGELRGRGADDPQEDSRRILLFGSFAADFNRDALAFTLDAVWPRVRSLAPEARLAVAGMGLPHALAERARHAGAEVLGEVRDVRSTLLTAAVVLIPLRFGGGLRIRLLESLALERAVVGTRIGVLGMGPRDGVEVVAADEPDALADSVVALLADPGRRAALGKAGRRWVSDHHDASAAAASQLELVARCQGKIDTPQGQG